VLPDKWPRPVPGIYCGYAGGLGPDNVVEQVKKISEVAGDVPFWIDAETKLFTNDRFDLDKVRRFLAAVGPYIKSS
jgi:phosphoribosylanthranilate isomerase